MPDLVYIMHLESGKIGIFAKGVTLATALLSEVPGFFLLLKRMGP
jgi:hypothetical protein